MLLPQWLCLVLDIIDIVIRAVVVVCPVGNVKRLNTIMD